MFRKKNKQNKPLGQDAEAKIFLLMEHLRPLKELLYMSTLFPERFQRLLTMLPEKTRQDLENFSQQMANLLLNKKKTTDVEVEKRLAHLDEQRQRLQKQINHFFHQASIVCVRKLAKLEKDFYLSLSYHPEVPPEELPVGSNPASSFDPLSETSSEMSNDTMEDIDTNDSNSIHTSGSDPQSLIDETEKQSQQFAQQLMSPEEFMTHKEDLESYLPLIYEEILNLSKFLQLRINSRSDHKYRDEEKLDHLLKYDLEWQETVEDLEETFNEGFFKDQELLEQLKNIDTQFLRLADELNKIEAVAKINFELKSWQTAVIEFAMQGLPNSIGLNVTKKMAGFLANHPQIVDFFAANVNDELIYLGNNFAALLRLEYATLNRQQQVPYGHINLLIHQAKELDGQALLSLAQLCQQEVTLCQDPQLAINFLKVAYAVVQNNDTRLFCQNQIVNVLANHSMPSLEQIPKDLLHEVTQLSKQFEFFAEYVRGMPTIVHNPVDILLHASFIHSVLYEITKDSRYIKQVLQNYELATETWLAEVDYYASAAKSFSGTAAESIALQKLQHLVSGADYVKSFSNQYLKLNDADLEVDLLTIQDNIDSILEEIIPPDHSQQPRP